MYFDRIYTYMLPSLVSLPLLLNSFLFLTSSLLPTVSVCDNECPKEHLPFLQKVLPAYKLSGRASWFLLLLWRFLTAQSSIDLMRVVTVAVNSGVQQPYHVKWDTAPFSFLWLLHSFLSPCDVPWALAGVI